MEMFSKYETFIPYTSDSHKQPRAYYNQYFSPPILEENSQGHLASHDFLPKQNNQLHLFYKLVLFQSKQYFSKVTFV